MDLKAKAHHDADSDANKRPEGRDSRDHEACNYPQNRGSKGEGFKGNFPEGLLSPAFAAKSNITVKKR
jgi:hypothetical protein